MLYDWTLRGVMRHRVLTMLLAVGTLVATVYLYGLVPKGFIPSQDTGQTSGHHRSSAGHLVRRAWCSCSSRWRTIVASDPNVEAFFSSVGRGRQQRRPATQAASSCV